ncbi:uncharacterized protein [Typha latifolia]|uniref:uncharacterized protein n=1 Tax=Typha latifolia TaxID=4733 RepID=UPI003C2B29A4
MAFAIFSHLQNLWPFSVFKHDDLKISTQLVQRLSIPDQTKQFVFAAREPDSHAVVYILAAQNLSELSALDAEYLIKEVQPKAVVAQVAPSALADIRAEEKYLKNDQANSVPTSPLAVLKRCFMEKMNKDQYEKLAGCQVLQEIFGIGFYGHFLAAKNAAEQIGSCFLLLESPYDNAFNTLPLGNPKSGDENPGLHLQTSCLVPGKVTSAIYSNTRRFCLTNALQSQMVMSLTPSLGILTSKASLSDSASEPEPEEWKSLTSYQAPSFAKSFYPLLADLYDIFSDLSSIGKALVSVQKLLGRIHEGEPVDGQILSDVYIFRIAIEGLRIALNNAARCRIDRTENVKSTNVEFFELPSEEKSHLLFAEAIRSQARKFGSVVAIVDASCLAGIRRHWNTPIPPKVAALADQCFSHYEDDDDIDVDEEISMDNMDQKGLWTDKPVVAVGAGATAILGASSLSKAVHASTFFKLATYKVPVALKYGLAQLQRTAAIGLTKILTPPKILSHGIANVGAKTSTMKFTASAEKIRTVTHHMIASAEKTSLLAMRTAFYEIMQRRRTQSVRFAPWFTFCCSMAACSSLLMHGDGIECAAESVPSVPMIASLGRGLQSLHHTSQEVKQMNGTKIQESLQSLMYSLKKMKVQ